MARAGAPGDSGADGRARWSGNRSIKCDRWSRNRTIKGDRWSGNRSIKYDRWSRNRTIKGDRWSGNRTIKGEHREERRGAGTCTGRVSRGRDQRACGG